MAEYDVLSGVVPVFVTALVVLFGGSFALLRWVIGRLLTEIEKRLERVDQLEKRFDGLLADLPMHYQMRDDSIREYTAINARLDRIYELLARECHADD